MRTDHLPFPMPERKHSLNQNWKGLTFMHWEVDPKILRKHIPNDLEIELFQGKAYIGTCLLYTSPSPRDATLSRMPSSA